MSSPPGGLVVRPAGAHDLPAMLSIWRELMDLHATRDQAFALAADADERWLEQAREMLGREDGFVLAAVVDGEVAGFCLGWVARNPPIYATPDIGFVSELAVRRQTQRRGVGRALVAAARAWFTGRGLVEFQLSTAQWNESAHAFWRALGGRVLLWRYQFPLYASPTPVRPSGHE